MALFIVLCSLGTISLLHVFNDIISLVIGYDASYAEKYTNIRKLMWIAVFTISEGINFVTLSPCTEDFKGKQELYQNCKRYSKIFLYLSGH